MVFKYWESVMKVKAYAAKNEKGLLEPYEYELGEIGSDDVDIEIENCGLCYSDVHYMTMIFQITNIPLFLVMRL